MKFCIECGHQLVPEARFCVSCGTASPVAPTTTAAATSAPPASGPVPEAQRQHEYAVASGSPAGDFQAGGSSVGNFQGSGSASGHGHARTQQATAAPARAAAPKQSTSPFAGVPVSDYVRDGVAALALIMSLFMAWSYGRNGTSTAATRVDVVLITLVSLLSLSLSYLWRAGVFGPAVGYRKIQDLKLLGNAPYVLLVVVYAAISLISADRFVPASVTALGPAAAFGLAGALLAAQPRRGEMAAGNVDEARNRRWILIVLGIAAVAAAAALAQIIRYWVVFSGMGGAGFAGWGIIGTLLALASAAVLVFIGLQVNKRSDSWRVVGVALAFGAGFLSLLALFEDLTLLNLGLAAFSPGFSLFFWMAFGAAVSAPSVARLTEGSAVAPTDTRAVLTPFLVLAAGLSAILALGAAIGLVTVAVDEYSDGIVPQVLALFFGLLLLAAALVALRVMGRDARSAYVIPSGFAGLLFLLGLVLLIVWTVQEESYLGPIIMLLTFVVPAAILAALWLPAASRDQFRSLPSANGEGASGFSFAGISSTDVSETASGSQAGSASGVTTGSQAAETGAAAAAVVVGPEILAEAANPATPLLRLQELAANYPLARPAVAANPSTYPALVNWLGQLGDPAVDQAIRQRG